MIDITMIKQLISKIFQGSGGTMSKQSILSKVAQMPQAQQLLPVLKQVPERKDYTEDGLTKEVQNVQQQGGGSAAEKIRSKIGV